MEPIFPQYSFGSVNLPIWQNNVVRFLSNHRKYRIFWWEFGPTLLDHLHKVKEDTHSDYTKNGLILTYSIASAALLISLASTRKVAFTAAVTSGVILLGVTTTVAIDYYSTKRKGTGEAIDQEHCLELLNLLGEMPKYWWWSWSEKMKDMEITEKQGDRAVNYNRYSFFWKLVLGIFTNVIAHQFSIVQYGYSYSYQKLKGEQVMDKEKMIGAAGAAAGAVGGAAGAAVGAAGKLATILGLKALYSCFANRASTASITNSSNELVATDRFSNLIRAVILSSNINNDSSISLNKTLELFELKWLLTRFDMSLKDVRNGKKSKDEHDRYAKDRIKDFKMLSLQYHPDKQQVSTSDTQVIINEARKALNNIHSCVMKESCVNQKYGYVYRLFGELSIDIINSGQSLSKIISVYACSKLHDLAYWEEGRLMEARNNYLKKMKSYYVGLLKSQMGLIRSIYNDGVEKQKIRNCIDSINKANEEFTRGHEEYRKFYEEMWVNNLKSLSQECKRSEELEIIKPEVEKLLKDSEEQCKILKTNSVDKVESDKVFVQPILECHTLMNIYYRFIIGLCANMYSCYNWHGKLNDNMLNQQRFIISEDETEFTKLSKQYIKNLSYQELLKFSDLMVSYYCNKGNVKELQEGINKYYSGMFSKKEIGNVLVFALDWLTTLLHEEFKPLSTFFEKEKVRIEEATEESKKVKELIKAIEAEIKQHTQARQTADERADQETQRANQEAQGRQEANQRLAHTLTVSQIFSKKTRKLDDELCDIVIAHQVSIVAAVVQHVMKYNSSPEQVLNAIMEDIKREGTVSDEIINNSIGNFTVRETLDEVQTKVEGVNVDHVAQGAGMNRNP